jgi:paraquat-inducible protein B
MQETADSAADTMKAGEVGVTAFSDGLPELQYRIGRALDELSASMRSIAGLTDYLERHPEALLKGKEGE